MRRRFLSLIGIAGLGLIAGLFFAPNTGRANRARLKNKAVHYGHTVGHVFTKWMPSKARYYGGRFMGLLYRAKDLIAKTPAALLLDDTTITDKVKSSLGRPSEQIEDSKMNINTEYGVVYLRGVARNLREKQRAERITKNTDGVIDVINELKIAA